MKTITRLGSIGLAITLLSVLAPAAERSNKYFRVTGRVLQIDKKDRTFLVTDAFSKKLYLIEVSETAKFKITYGRYMRMAEPAFEDVRTGERVEIRCVRTGADHLALLDDGTTVQRITATR